MDIVVSIAAEIAKYSIAPIGRSIGYMIYYNRNMRTLQEEVNNLGEKRSWVQGSVDAAKRNLEVIKPEVETWLATVNKLNEEVKTFLEGEDEINKSGWCSGPITRYSLSRKAKKKTRAITKLKGKGSFEKVSYPLPPLGIEVIATGGFADFESRKLIMDDIMAALKDDNIKAIGICGLGGVGKTTTVKEVGKRAKIENLSDEVVMVVVTQTPVLIDIQGEIAERLGLKFKDKNLRVRADRLQARLLQCKSILVILDDVWEKLELEKIGIPFGGNNGCKLMMTSRSQEVCIAMKTCKPFTIGVLSDEEAWSLLKDKAGDSIDSGELRQIATEVIKECGGLPIAIITVGTALKDKPKEMWDDALLQLRQSSPENISGMNKQVYRSLELSFNCLESPEAKSCLLLCCIYKEDANIPLQDLVKYGVGLGLFKGIKELVQAINRVYTLVHQLKSCYLLLDSEMEECVKMHDVVRDVIISIATTGKEDLVLRHGLEVKEWPAGSTGDEPYTSTSLIYHKIQQLLLLDIKGSENVPNDIIGRRHGELIRRRGILGDIENMPYEMISDSQNVPSNLFEGMNELRVLELRRMLVPSSLSLLTNLRTLRLQNCHMENVSLIGELKMLRILSFRGSFIREVPREIGELIHLQSLELTDCHRLEKISPGVLSSLIRLEQLYMRYCYNVQWEVDEECTSERNNVNLAELESLSDHLTTLEIDLPSSAKILGGFKKLVRFSIYIGNEPLDPMSAISRNELIMKLDSRIPIESWINEVLKKTETLDFQVCGVKNVVNNVNQERYVQLKSLEISNCDMLEYVIDTMDLVHQSIFPVLETLFIRGENMEMICRGKLPAGSFTELRSIALVDCKRLEIVFSESIARCLVQLEELDIRGCYMMKEIVVTEKDAEEKVITSKIRFSKLRELMFYGLASLVGFSKKMGGIEFPELRRLHLERLPELRSLCPTSSVGNSEGKYEYEESATRHVFNQKVSFPRLEVLEVNQVKNIGEIWYSQLPSYSFYQLRVLKVFNCDKILQLAPFHLLIRLHNLEEVFVSGCNSLEEVIEFKGQNVEEGHAVILPGSLEHMSLNSLKRLHVSNCANLRNLFNTSVARGFVHLQHLSIYKCVMMEEIVTKGEEQEEGTMDNIMLPQLKLLSLDCLPNLTSFCQGLYDFDLPSLQYLRVESCPKMRTFSLGFASTPKLEKVVVDGFDRQDLMGDLNNTIQQLFQRQQVDEMVPASTRLFLFCEENQCRPATSYEEFCQMFGDFEGIHPSEELFANILGMVEAHSQMFGEVDDPSDSNETSCQDWEVRQAAFHKRMKLKETEASIDYENNDYKVHHAAFLKIMKLKHTKASNDHETNNNVFVQMWVQMFGEDPSDFDETKSSFKGSLHLEELFAECSGLEENQCRPETSYQAHCQVLFHLQSQEKKSSAFI